MSVYAVIDVGTNSVKFHVAERLPDGTWRKIVDRAEVTRLGEGLSDTGDIAPAAIERTVTAIADMADEAKRHGAAALVAVGTMGMRTASNSDAFIARVRERTRRHHRGDLGRGGRAARLSGREVRDRPGRGESGHPRHRRRKHPVHLRPRHDRR